MWVYVLEVGEQVGSTFLSDQPRYLDNKTVRVESGWVWMGGWVRKVRWMVLDGVGWFLGGREWREGGEKGWALLWEGGVKCCAVWRRKRALLGDRCSKTG